MGRWKSDSTLGPKNCTSFHRLHLLYLPTTYLRLSWGHQADGFSPDSNLPLHPAACEPTVKAWPYFISPDFPLLTRQGEQLILHLSVPILTSSQPPRSRCSYFVSGKVLHIASTFRIYSTNVYWCLAVSQVLEEAQRPPE